jgi:hypothetical protein
VALEPQWPKRLVPKDLCQRTCTKSLARLRNARCNERRMRGYTFKEKARIMAGAAAALVVVGWLAVLATAFLSVR